MNLAHPYGYPVALALIAIATFFFTAAYRELDQLLETRRNRRLDRAANAELRQQLTDQT